MQAFLGGILQVFKKDRRGKLARRLAARLRIDRPAVYVAVPNSSQNPGFPVLRQLNVGEGSAANPHDVIAVSAHKAYVTRYDRPELWIVDPEATSCAGFRRPARSYRQASASGSSSPGRR